MCQGFVHGKLFRLCQVERKGKWFEFVPEGVVENNEVMLLWDVNIQCDIRLLRQVLRTWMCGT